MERQAPAMETNAAADGGVYRQDTNVVPRSLGDDLVLIPLLSDVDQLDCLYALNELGAYIWSQIDGRRTVGEIAQAIVSEFDVDLQTARTDLVAFLADLSEVKAVQVVPT